METGKDYANFPDAKYASNPMVSSFRKWLKKQNFHWNKKVEKSFV